MKRHSTDLVSLIFGGIFLFIAAWWVVGRILNEYAIQLMVPHGGWFVAAGLIVLGVLGIAASLRRSSEPVSGAPAEPATVAAPVSAEPASYSSFSEPASYSSSTSSFSEPASYPEPASFPEPAPFAEPGSFPAEPVTGESTVESTEESTVAEPDRDKSE